MFNVFFNVWSLQTCPKTLFSWVKFDFIISTFFQKPTFFLHFGKEFNHPKSEGKATEGTKIALMLYNFGFLLTTMPDLMGQCQF